MVIDLAQFKAARPCMVDLWSFLLERLIKSSEAAIGIAGVRWSPESHQVVYTLACGGMVFNFGALLPFAAGSSLEKLNMDALMQSISGWYSSVLDEFNKQAAKEGSPYIGKHFHHFTLKVKDRDGIRPA
jgi:hypothetical protein